MAGMISVGVSYSSTVELWLHANGKAHKIVKAGPNRLMPESSVDIPSGPAVLLISVDDVVQRLDVNLPHGAVPFERFIEFDCGGRELRPLEVDR